MEFWLFWLLFYSPSIVEKAQDPIDGWAAPPAALQDLECEPVTVDAARRRAPAEIPEPSARGDFLERRALICRERLMPKGVRVPRDDAILAELRGSARSFAGLVAQLEPEERGRTWLVEAFHPDQAISYKLGFAVKNALLDRELRVTDRAPTLAAGDLEVIGSVKSDVAYPLACARYLATGSLKEGDALLAVVLRHPHETRLHAGVCADGRWRWLE